MDSPHIKILKTKMLMKLPHMQDFLRISSKTFFVESGNTNSALLMASRAHFFVQKQGSENS
jgi:hypothetical protein